MISSIPLAYTGMPLPPALAQLLPADTRSKPHFRIPAITVTRSNRIIVAFDARPSFYDLPGDLSIVYRYSDDFGNTWSELRLLAGARDGWGYGDAALLALTDGRILCAYVASRGLSFWDDDANFDSWRLMIAQSSDNGLTWKHRSVNAQLLDNNNIKSAFFASGNGIELSQSSPFAGRIIFPIVFRARDGRIPFTAMALSSDGGVNWHLSRALDHADESKVVENADGDVILSIRGYPQRRWAISRDGGETWSETESYLAEPGCNAGFTRWKTEYALTIPQPYFAQTTSFLQQTQSLNQDPSRGRSAKSLQDWNARRNLCLLMGENYSDLEHVLTIDPRAAAYSVTACLPNGELAVVWERGDTVPYDEIAFATVKPEQINAIH